ncbi:hypothetical protein AQI88_24090 [Streptomyces cellostaticus]|uniref:Uncharacterized protein n=1 Tax=Streptomyces cellostaticus TaxID=67285 RepID=A0A101NJD1_9ACTN|nr:hypothetical protein [Streptomyces cellostaticus]KUM94064.1 hypothetical protein AQI88_24090 [Streptomyces cellostaticus]GHI05001.1 hypothetical protein Scel_33220 [Streptomyces cellostaticus]
MTYVVTVAMAPPKGALELDVLQREGVIFLLRKGFDSLEAIEGPDGMEIELMDDVIAAHPGGVLLKLFVDAPALEFAEGAAREVVAELLERTEPLADWQITRCAVELNSELLQESLDAADGPDAPPADPAERARRHAAAAPPATPGGPDAAEAKAMRATLRALAPGLKAFPLDVFGYCSAPEERTVGREAAEVAAGAVIYAIDLLIDELFTDLAALEEDGPTVAESDTAFMILDDLPPQYAVEYTVLFVRRLVVTAVSLTGRLTQPQFGQVNCVAEELLLGLLLTQAEVMADMYGLLTEEVTTALETFADGVHENAALDRLDVVPTRAGDWFTPLDDERSVHPYAANDEEETLQGLAE